MLGLSVWALAIGSLDWLTRSCRIDHGLLLTYEYGGDMCGWPIVTGNEDYRHSMW